MFAWNLLCTPWRCSDLAFRGQATSLSHHAKLAVGVGVGRLSSRLGELATKPEDLDSVSGINLVKEPSCPLSTTCKETKALGSQLTRWSGQTVYQPSV